MTSRRKDVKGWLFTWPTTHPKNHKPPSVRKVWCTFDVCTALSKNNLFVHFWQNTLQFIPFSLTTAIWTSARVCILLVQTLQTFSFFSFAPVSICLQFHTNSRLVYFTDSFVWLLSALFTLLYNFWLLSAYPKITTTLSLFFLQNLRQ